MNPVPPAKTFLPMARKVETKDEYASELAFYRGGNEEGIVFSSTEQMLTDPLPPTVPYAVMFDEDCGGDTEFCQRILPPLTRATQELASVGAGGRFVLAEGAGHNIFATDPELVLTTIDDVLEETRSGGEANVPSLFASHGEQSFCVLDRPTAAASPSRREPAASLGRLRSST
jgi:hypothetical protein